MNRDCADACVIRRMDFVLILNKQLDKKKGNVYYDLQTSGLKHFAGTQVNMFEGTEWKNIEKRFEGI